MTASPVIRSYEELIKALDQRRRDLGLSLNELDERSGLHSGYCGHLFAWQSKTGRGLGKMSLGLILESMGLGLVVVEIENVKAQPTPRCGPVVRLRPAQREADRAA